MDTYKSLNILYQLRGCQPLCTILLPEALGVICQSNTQIYVSQLTSLLLHPDNNIPVVSSLVGSYPSTVKLTLTSHVFHNPLHLKKRPLTNLKSLWWIPAVVSGDVLLMAN